jgi:hypothetical protein
MLENGSDTPLFGKNRTHPHGIRRHKTDDLLAIPAQLAPGDLGRIEICERGQSQRGGVLRRKRARDSPGGKYLLSTLRSDMAGG